MPPTPLWNGAQAQFLSLANPDTTAEKIAIYARYQIDSGFNLASGPGSPNPGLAPGGGFVLVKQLLLGDALVPSSHIISTTTLTEAQVIAAGVSQVDIDDLHANATGLIRYYKYIYRNDTSPAATPAEYHSTASAAITVLPALGADHGVVTIQDTLGYKRYFSVPLSAGSPATVTVSGMEAGVATFKIQLLVAGTPVTNGFRKYSLSKNQIRSVAFPEGGPSPTYPLAQIARVLLTQANQNDEGTGVLIAGRKAKLLIWLWDPQGKVSATNLSARVYLPNGGSQVIPAYFTNQETAPHGTAELDIAPGLVQPGATFTVETGLPDGTLLSKTYTPNIQPGKRPTVHVFEVSPGPGFSGVPVARDAASFRDQIGKWVEDQLPVSGINIDIRYGFPFPPSNPGIPFYSDPGYTITDLLNLAGVMDGIAATEGHPRTDGNIYLAMINGRYAQTSYSGITPGKGFPGIAMFMFSQENARHTFTHELGHAYWLGHSPSPGATTDPNPVDWDYPYGGDSMIAFTPWSALLGGGLGALLPTTNHDLMAYYAPINQWISDFNWARFFERTQDSGLPFLASQSPSDPTTLLPKFKSGSPFVIGPKEAQALADYLDAAEPMACGAMTAEELETAKAKARQAPISPMPVMAGGPPVIVNVKHLVRPQREIHAAVPTHTPTELDQLLALPEAPKGRRR